MMSSKQKKIFFAVVMQFALGDTLFHNHRCWYRPSIAKKKKKISKHHPVHHWIPNFMVTES